MTAAHHMRGSTFLDPVKAQERYIFYCRKATLFQQKSRFQYDLARHIPAVASWHQQQAAIYSLAAREALNAAIFYRSLLL